MQLFCFCVETDDTSLDSGDELSGDILTKLGVDTAVGFALVMFGDSDPLGANFTHETKHRSRRHRREGSSGKQRGLGQQAAALHDSNERITALERIVQSSGILLCRNVITHLLSLVVSLEDDSQVVSALKKIGLVSFSDLIKIARLISAERMGNVSASKLSLADLGKLLGKPSNFQQLDLSE